jgi:surfactin family lipopeptide synthetase A
MERKDYPHTAGLSAEKRALFEYLLEQEGIDTPQPQTILPRENPDQVPLSFGQERLWFLNQLEPHGASYNEPTAIRVTGPLDVTVLERCVHEIVRRHEALRTIFTIIAGEPVQVVRETMSLNLPVEDLRDLPEHEREAQVSKLATEEFQKPFDLAEGPLLRLKILRLAAQEHVLVLTMHHIISDGWSVGVLFRELGELYRAFSSGKPSPLPELPIQYADFALWQRRWMQGGVLEAHLAYWKAKLGGTLPMLELPTDHARSPVQTSHGARYYLSLPKPLSEGLKTLSQRQGVTLFMALLAAFQTLLYRYTGQDDLLVGSPSAGRNWPQTEGLIGCFLNTLVFRTDMSGNPSFRGLLARVREVAMEVYGHQDLPFEQLVEAVQPERDLSRNPLFQVMFVLQNALTLELPGLSLSRLKLDRGATPLDLLLSMEDTDQGLTGWLEYNTDLFAPSTIARMAEHFQTLLEGVTANPEQRLSWLPMLTQAERHQLLVEWNNTPSDYPKDVCIHQLFEAQVERTPDAVALLFEEQQLTYRQLNRRANQLAYYLRALGVGPESLVGICMERSPEMVLGLLGILKAGGAYVPLDPGYPNERLAFMLEDSQATVLLTQQRLESGFELSARGPRLSSPSTLPISDSPAPHVVCVDTDWENIAQESEENLTSGVTADNLAYVIYTSGSTGRAKGVAIEHRSTVALLDWARAIFTPEQLAGVLASTSICFDLSVFELLVPLSWGGKVILAESALCLPALPAAKNVTLINTVPSTIAELLRVNGVPPSVRTVNLAGEPLKRELVQEIYQQRTIREVFDLYGPSEDTTYSTFALRSATGRATIGHPIANTQIYVLDTSLQPVPIVVPGELHIGGAGLARAYLHRPGLTAEKFIPNPFSSVPGARLYQTGDLARYCPDGNIEFLGRLDNQVKIRGFRIELGEIETALGQHPAIQETVVIAREDRANEKRLVAYVVPNQQPAPTVSELRCFLQQSLPDHMVPSAFVLLDALPLTPNGKVDRRGLRVPEGLRPELEAAYVEPQTEVERIIAGLWQEALHVQKVGRHDNFFDLGGHSLLLIRVHSALQRALSRQVPLVDMFKYPTISTLVAYLSQERPVEPSLQQTRDRAEFRGDSIRRQRQLRQRALGNNKAGKNSG